MRSIHAKALADRLFHKRIVKAKRGKGSYSRKEKHRKNG
jgi:stalled ribosome alternative rescue factor ArfA